jgi:phage repressor protein C with HTH and peptisase S24 domain
MENDVNTAKEIGRQLRAYFEQKGMTQKQVADILGIQQQNVGVHFQGRPFGKNAATKWQNAFGFSAHWLMTGQGKMMSDDVTPYTNLTPSTPSELDDLVPIVPNGVTNISDSQPKVHQFPRYDFYFQCVTDAMRPEICQGDLLGIRRLEPTAPLINGETYVFDTKSAGMQIRMLEEKEDGYLATAHNDRYKDTFFPRSEIISIFTIVGLVRVK